MQHELKELSEKTTQSLEIDRERISCLKELVDIEKENKEIYRGFVESYKIRTNVLKIQQEKEDRGDGGTFH